MAPRQAGRRRAYLMKRGDIWLVGLDPTEGHEQKGRRPVLIVSPDAFNRVTKVPVVVPVTSRGSFARTAGFAVPLAGAGTQTTGIPLRSTPRLRYGRTRRQEARKRPQRHHRRSPGQAGDDI
jgi:mRNA-degrading endonuclease toxin of MazEF toxin-antitoxin module